MDDAKGSSVRVKYQYKTIRTPDDEDKHNRDVNNYLQSLGEEWYLAKIDEAYHIIDGCHIYRTTLVMDQSVIVASTGTPVSTSSASSPVGKPETPKVNTQ